MMPTDDITRIAPCTSVDGNHMHIAVYLISDGTDNILVDTGSVVDRDTILERVEVELDGEDLNALLLSHTDLPHSGNISPIVSRWPDCEVWCGSNNPESHDLPDGTRTYDDTNRIGERRFHFVDPIIKDRTNTTWILDEESGVLFTSDGFGYHHAPDECDLTLGELVDSGRYSVENVEKFHRTSLPWLRYAAPELLRHEIDSILDQHEVSYIAPSHGPLISEEYIDHYLEDFYGVVTSMAEEYRARQPTA